MLIPTLLTLLTSFSLHAAEPNPAMNRALFTAVRGGNAELTDIIIREGGDPNARDCIDGGTTPLMVASDLGFEDVATVLLSHGADANAT